jgi:hypothetical protein
MHTFRMMMTTAGLLALASCGGGDGQGGNEASGNAAAGGSAGSASAGVQLQAGQWEMTQQTLNVTAPGMPAGAADMMKTGPITVKTCITPEQAQKPSADLFSGKTDPNCKQEGFSSEGGKVSGTMTCSGGDTPGKTVMKMDGEFSPTEFDIEMEMTTEAQGSQMTMEMRSSGRRIGDCPAGGQAG